MGEKMKKIIKSSKWSDSQMEYQLTTLKQKIKDAKKQIDLFMNKDKYYVLEDRIKIKGKTILWLIQGVSFIYAVSYAHMIG